jgi:hypothetical protein
VFKVLKDILKLLEGVLNFKSRLQIAGVRLKFYKTFSNFFRAFKVLKVVIKLLTGV